MDRSANGGWMVWALGVMFSVLLLSMGAVYNSHATRLEKLERESYSIRGELSAMTSEIKNLTKAVDALSESMRRR